MRVHDEEERKESDQRREQEDGQEMIARRGRGGIVAERSVKAERGGIRERKQKDRIVAGPNG